MLKRFLQLNGLSIVAVVCSHASEWVYIALFWWADRYRAVTAPNFDLLGTPQYYGVVVLQTVGIFAVPGFLFATGFFAAYANRGRSGMRWQHVGVRLKNLLIPYAVWSVLILIADFAQGGRYSALEYLRRLCFGFAVPAYFYVIVLCQLYLLSPLLVPLAKKHSQWLLMGSGALLLIVIGIFYWNLYVVVAGIDSSVADLARKLVPSRSFVRWLFFFSLGMVAGFHLKALKQWLARMKWVLLVTAIVSFPLAVFEIEWIFQKTGLDWRGGVFTITGSLYALSVILAFLSFEKVNLPFAKRCSNVGKASFGIYLLHPMMLEFFARAIQKFVPRFLMYPLLFQLGLVVLGVGVPLVVMELVNRSPLHRYYRYLFG